MYGYVDIKTTVRKDESIETVVEECWDPGAHELTTWRDWLVFGDAYVEVENVYVGGFRIERYYKTLLR